MAKKNNKKFNQLSKIYNLALTGNEVSDITKIKPARVVKTPSGNDKIETIDSNFPSTIQLFLREFYDKIRNKYINETQIEFSRLIDDLDDMYQGEPRVARAKEHLGAEIAQADSSDIIITIDSKDKSIVKYIEEYNMQHKIPDKLRDCIDDYSGYGNHVWVISLSDIGVSAITPLRDLKHLKQRYEFSPSDVESFKGQHLNVNNSERMNSYLDGISNLKEFNYFENYLFGYDISGQLLPPWNVVHFRNKPYKSLFSPFGEPPFLGSLTPYKNYDIIRGLRAALLSANLPREMIGVNFEKSVHRTEIMQALVDLAARWQNTGLKKPAKEGMGISETVIYPSELMDIEYKSPGMTLPDEADLEFAVNDIIVSTHLPRELLEESDGWGNDSGASIIEKSKFFYREVYKHQTTIATTLADHYKTAMILSGDFELDKIEFTLAFPYPETMVDDDLISTHSNMIRLANDTVEMFSSTLAGQGALPPEAIQMVLREVLPFSSGWLDEIIKLITKSQEADANMISEKFFNLRKAINESKSEKFKKCNIKVTEFVENYYKQIAMREGKLTESVLKKRIPLTEKKVQSTVFDIRKNSPYFLDYYHQGSHIISSRKTTDYYIEAIDRMYDKSNKKDKTRNDFRDMKYLQESDIQKRKNAKKKNGKVNK